jgi:hypothetical protein
MNSMTVTELARFNLFSAKSRRAFFAPNSLAYGTSRMFMAFSEFHGDEQMECRPHFHGISSAIEKGVCPNWFRYFFEGFFFRLRTLPRSMTTSCS